MAAEQQLIEPHMWHYRNEIHSRLNADVAGMYRVCANTYDIRRISMLRDICRRYYHDGKALFNVLFNEISYTSMTIDFDKAVAWDFDYSQLIMIVTKGDANMIKMYAPKVEMWECNP